MCSAALLAGDTFLDAGVGQGRAIQSLAVSTICLEGHEGSSFKWDFTMTSFECSEVAAAWTFESVSQPLVQSSIPFRR